MWFLHLERLQCIDWALSLNYPNMQPISRQFVCVAAGADTAARRKRLGN